MNRLHPVVVGIAILAVVALVAVAVGPLLSPSPAVEQSTYGYSVSLATNATLTNVTLVVPLSVADDGRSPVADAIRTGNATVPESWRYDVVERDGGLASGASGASSEPSSNGRLALRIEADEVPAERRSDGNRYSTYLFGATVPADDVIETGDPFGTEPTVALTDGLRERPCPNLAEPNPDKTCFAFDARAYAAYDAPEDALVTVTLVHNGVNRYEGSGHEMYYERLSLAFRGPQDGWTAVDGFASAENRS